MISEDILSTEYLGQDKPVNRITPVVSICIITYNHVAFIKECLDSILMQETDFPFEIIIGEDNSTDGTREICIEYAERHPDLIRLYLRRPDQKIEVYGKRTFHFNFIENLKAARGKYIAFCEGDDYWTDPLKLQKQVDLIKEKNASLVLNSHVGPFDGKIIQYNLKDIGYLTHKGHTSSWLFLNVNFSEQELYAMHKCSAGDICIILFMAKRGPVVYHRIRTTFYRIHSGGVYSSLDMLTRAKDGIRNTMILREHMPFISFLRRLMWQTKAFIKSYLK